MSEQDERFATLEFATLKKALAFASCKQKKRNESDEDWAKRATKGLRVVGPKATYTIDPHGRVSAVGDDRLTPTVVKKHHGELCLALDHLIKSKEKPEAKRAYLGKSKNIFQIDFSAVSGLWVLYGIHGTQVKPWVVVPTNLNSFVKYAILLLSKKPWVNRLRRCDVKDCGKYFLAPRRGRKGGRPREVCSDRCAENRGDPTNAERQRRFRETRHAAGDDSS